MFRRHIKLSCRLKPPAVWRGGIKNSFESGQTRIMCSLHKLCRNQAR
ncbi:hypothetical protein NEILACOT_04920 [Neisseria lactamica ATCC 23970]|uniref:Uncharacterized protein n=1 Tax=Neisseria lactamica ATCC 23970 TaxID=546265 RepID=D0WBJ3_NEILA|nr:hypothetical protein NEILACOT_04920 [Neisseria lactamica ATCC 23970]